MTPDDVSARRITTWLTALAVIATAAFLWRGVAVNIEQAYSNPDSHYDFRARYLSSTSLREGANPYSADPTLPAGKLARELGVPFDHEIYAPGVLVWFIPLSWLDFSAARAAFLLLKVIGIGLSIALMAKMATPLSGAAAVALAVAMTLGFETGIRELTVGQLNFVILPLLCIALFSIDRGRDAIGGAALGAAILVKPMPALLFVPLLLRGRWRAVIAAAVFYAGYHALMIAIYGLDMHIDHARAVYGTARGWNAWWANQSFMGLFVRIGKANQFTTSWFDWPLLVRLLWFATSASLLAVVALVTAARRQVPLRLTLSMWIAVALLVNTRSWDHYWVWCLPGAIQLAAVVVQRGRPIELAGLVVFYALLSFPGQYWKDFPALAHGLAIPLGSSQTFAACVLIAALLALHLYDGDAADARRAAQPARAAT